MLLFCFLDCQDGAKISLDQRKNRSQVKQLESEVEKLNGKTEESNQALKDITTEENETSEALHNSLKALSNTEGYIGILQQNITKRRPQWEAAASLATAKKYKEKLEKLTGKLDEAMKKKKEELEIVQDFQTAIKNLVKNKVELGGDRRYLERQLQNSKAELIAAKRSLSELESKFQETAQRAEEMKSKAHTCLLNLRRFDPVPKSREQEVRFIEACNAEPAYYQSEIDRLTAEMNDMRTRNSFFNISNLEEVRKSHAEAKKSFRQCKNDFKTFSRTVREMKKEIESTRWENQRERLCKNIVEKFASLSTLNSSSPGTLSFDHAERTLDFG